MEAAEIAIQRMSELLPVKGIDLVGLLPAGVATGSKPAEAAQFLPQNSLAPVRVTARTLWEIAGNSYRAETILSLEVFEYKVSRRLSVGYADQSDPPLVRSESDAIYLIADLSRAGSIYKVRELLQDMRIRMLTTVQADGTLHSRPMAMQQAPFDGEPWFFT